MSIVLEGAHLPGSFLQSPEVPSIHIWRYDVPTAIHIVALGILRHKIVKTGYLNRLPSFQIHGCVESIHLSCFRGLLQAEVYFGVV